MTGRPAAVLWQLRREPSASGAQIFGKASCVCLFGLSLLTQINGCCTIDKGGHSWGFDKGGAGIKVKILEGCVIGRIF